jgi:hypothetical protein
LLGADFGYELLPAVTYDESQFVRLAMLQADDNPQVLRGLTPLK